MNVQIVAVLIQEVGKFASYLLKNRPVTLKTASIAIADRNSNPPETPALSEKATSAATGCLPCSLNHLSTCSGLLNEAVRFARKDGMGSTEVIDRANMCLDELNAMERVDLRPEMIVNLPTWEKPLADEVLNESRNLRHKLESMSNVDELEKVAASTQTTRNMIGRSWAKEKIANLSPEERENIQKQAEEKALQIIEGSNG